MKKSSSLIWGLVLIAAGIIIGGNTLNLFDVDIFFDGWWTLFIIIPCFVNLFTEKDKTGSIIGLLIGVLLLLSCLNILDFDLVLRLFFPIIIIVIGLSMIFKNLFDKEVNESIKKINTKLNSKDGVFATFSGQDIKLDDEEFKGTTLNAIFGGIKLDLRNATIKEDVVINCTSVFGGIDIFVPDNVKIKIKSNSIFGGVDNKKKKNGDSKKEVTIYVDAMCLFGGVDIK